MASIPYRAYINVFPLELNTIAGPTYVSPVRYGDEMLPP